MNKLLVAALAAMVFSLAPAPAFAAWKDGLIQAKYSNTSFEDLCNQSENDIRNHHSPMEPVLGTVMADMPVSGDDNTGWIAPYLNPLTGHSWQWDRQYSGWAYAGQMYVENGVTYTFGKHLDDAARIIIDGHVVINNAGYNDWVTGNYTAVKTGWVSFDARAFDGWGGKGPIGSWHAGEGNWAASLGIAYNTNGVNYADPASNWTKLYHNPANGTRFRYDDGLGFDDNLTIESVPPGVGASHPFPFGSHAGFAPDSNFTASVDAVWTNTAQDVTAVADRWETWREDGSGNSVYAPAPLGDLHLGGASSGTGASFEYTHPNTAGKIIWFFTASNLVTATSGPGGHIVSGDGWHEHGLPVALEAAPDSGSGNTFLRWVGEVPAGANAADNPLVFTCDKPRTLRAVFATGVQYVAMAQDGGNDANDGFSPLAPKLTIAAAIADLGGAGGTVWVADGDYGVYAAVQINTPVAVRGMSGNPSDVTVRRIPQWAVSHSVFTLNHPGARVESMTVRDGLGANGQNIAGNIHIAGSGGTVSNCVITAGTTGGGWGPMAGGVGIYGAQGLVTHCVIIGNTSFFGEARHAGGVFIDAGRLEHCLVFDNHADNGGRDWGFGVAGGIHIRGGSVLNCTVTGNSSRYVGGVYILPDSDLGWAGYDCVLTNTVIAGNTSTYYAGLNPGDDPNAPNTHEWGTFHTSWGLANFFHRCATSTAAPLNGTCFAAPAETLFANLATGDFSPAPGSALIDNGASVSNEPALDLAGNDRVMGAGIDIGCFEYNPELFTVSFVCDPRAAVAPAQVVFTATVGGTNGNERLGFDWQLDGGVVQNLALADHPVATNLFDVGGLYTVTLTVTDLDNPTQTASMVWPDCLRIPHPKIHVWADNDLGVAAAPYHDWANAAATLDDAMAIALPGCEIVIRKGFYETGETILDFPLRIYGESGVPGDVVLNRGHRGRLMKLHHAAARVEGVTLQGGYSNRAGGNVFFDTFGGTVSNCVLRGAAGEDGSAVMIAHESHNALLTHCVITNNTIIWSGAILGARAGRIENCLVAGNWHSYKNENSLIVDLRAEAVLRNCTFAGNEVNRVGIFRTNWPGWCAMVNCVVAGNYPWDPGQTPPLISHGEGDEWNASGRFIQCTTDGETPATPSSNTGTAGQIFKDPANGDYRLRSLSSPAANVGERVNPADYPAVDLDGNPRVFGSRIDNGCYELQVGAGTLFLVR